MPAYNTQFELSLRDIDLIETALRTRKKELSLRTLPGGEADEATRAELADIHALLGRLHNQKVFYRPKAGSDAPYISG